MIFFELFSNAPEIVGVPAEQALFRAGEHGDAMYVLIRGSADVVVGERRVEVLQPGDIVGEMSLISPGPRSATVVACEDSAFIAIDEARFKALLREAPDFALKVMRTLTERLRRTNAHLSA
jgi:CRP-like cAMP-binding protein